MPRRSLLIIYKSFIRPHLDYGDVIYDQLSNASFSNKNESVQYNTVLAITGSIKGSSHLKYQELGLSTSNKEDGWDNCACSINFYQSCNHHIFITYSHKWEILTETPIFSMYFLVELNTSKILFFPHVINEWNKLDLNIRCFSNYHIFRNALLKFIRPVEKNNLQY